MNPTHLHLLLNHVPVLGTVFGLGLLLFELWRRSEDIMKAALSVFVIVALLGVPVYLTGEPAEDGVKSIPGVSKPIMELHEKAATIAFIGVVVLGLAALAGLILYRRGKLLPSWFGVSVLAASLMVSDLMAWTANMGGQIRHTEIRSHTSTPAVIGDRAHE